MPREPVRRARFRGEVEFRHEADALVTTPGDMALIMRGRPRSLVFACPDGCGERLTINLDPQAGRAWTLFRNKRGLTLFPSVWRDNGCRSHFILWDDVLLWFGRDEDDSREPEGEAGADLERRVLASLGPTFEPYSALAARLNTIPWEVERVCRHLAGRGLAERGHGERRDQFRKAAC